MTDTAAARIKRESFYRVLRLTKTSCRYFNAISDWAPDPEKIRKAQNLNIWQDMLIGIRMTIEMHYK